MSRDRMTDLTEEGICGVWSEPTADSIMETRRMGDALLSKIDRTNRTVINIILPSGRGAGKTAAMKKALGVIDIDKQDYQIRDAPKGLSE